jgi:polyhydroxyalkanoate synthesis regulator phasin
MSASERYRQHAAQCIRASQHARTAAAKHLLMVMAQRWNDVADLVEKGSLEAEQAQAMARDLLSARESSAA